MAFLFAEDPVQYQTIFLLLFCLSISPNIHAASSDTQPDKDYFSRLLYAVCSIGNCDKTLNPNIPQDANEIISNSAYIVYNTEYDKLEKYNAPLKTMNIESAMLVPTKWVEDAVCKYYGLSIDKNPELQKAAEEQSKYGFYIVNMSDAGEALYEIEKMDVMKNGILRAIGTSIGGDDFQAYFGKSNCGGKPHWVPLRVVDMKPYEESENFHAPLD